MSYASLEVAGEAAGGRNIVAAAIFLVGDAFSGMALPRGLLLGLFPLALLGLLAVLLFGHEACKHLVGVVLVSTTLSTV